MDGLATELGTGFRIAAFQQRGLEPSTLAGPFTIAQAIDDVIAVLDGLGWQRAVLVGHSWGGHLVLRTAASYADRLVGVLSVDPIGVVGDGGTAAFEAEMGARTPKAGRVRAQELDERAMAGEGTPEDALEGLAIMWPAYFADPDNASPMPRIRLSVEAYSGLIGEMREVSTRSPRHLRAGASRTGWSPVPVARFPGARQRAPPPSSHRARFSWSFPAPATSPGSRFPAASEPRCSA